MNTESFDDIISAALDGERVDVEALRRALATDEGRQSLAAFVLLRAATAADDIRPAHPEFVGAELAPPLSDDGVAPPVPRTRRNWLLAGARVPAALAASIAIVAVAASFLLGTTLRAPLTLVAPPIAPATTPAQVIVPAPTPAISGDRPSEGFREAGGPRLGRVAEEPPKPTRVLRFEWGVDWRAGS